MEKVKITHPDKILFPKSKITKGDIVQYYRSVSKWMLPHMQGRPVSIQRFPGGIDNQNFFQKEVQDYFPTYVKRLKVKLKTGETKPFLTVSNEETLEYLTNLGAIPYHIWLSCKGKLNSPDLLIWDFDPSDNNFSKVREGAFIAQEFLKNMGIEPYLKTTGSRGLHVMVPILPDVTFTKSRSVAKKLAAMMVKANPKLLTLNFEKASRGKKVFVDYLRNGFAQTAIAPYSLRAIEGAPVAAPISWEELEDGNINAQSFTISNILPRLKEKGDLLAEMFQKPVSLANIVKEIKSGT